MNDLIERDPDAVSERASLPRRHVFAVSAVTIFALCFVAALLGFVHYLSQLRTANVLSERTADGIVVLTGGSSRVSDAMELLAGGYGKRLLISGVYPTNGIAEISRSLPDNQRLLMCCVDLDRSAVNTRSNAIETRRWAKEQGFRSLIVVTSNYHMPRALAEMSHEMPDIELIPVSVIGELWRDEAWWTSASTLRLLLSEYAKYVAVGLRVRLATIGIDLFPEEAASIPDRQKSARSVTEPAK